VSASGSDPPIDDGITAEAVVLDHPEYPDGAARPAPAEESDVAMRLRLSVELPDAEPYEVELDCQAPMERTPLPGQRLPVTVDREDRTRVRVEWDQVPDVLDQARMLIDAAIPTGDTSAAPVAPADPTTERLQTLVELHDAGALTEEEFSAQAERVLSEQRAAGDSHVAGRERPDPGLY